MTLNMQKVIVRLRKAATNRYWRVLIDFSIITFIAVMIFRTWLFTNEWPAGGDVSGWISRAYIFGKDFRWLYTWRPFSFGFVEGINPMDFFLMLINTLFNSPATTIKIFMFSSFLTAGFSMYGLTYHYTHRHMAALAGSMVYLLNQWVFSQYTEAHVDILFSYALAPLVFLVLIRALERRKLKDILGLALALALLVTSFHPESIVIYGLFLFMFTVFYLLSSARMKNPRGQTKHLLKLLLPAVAVCLLISAFLFIPLALNISAPYYSPSYKFAIEDAVAASYGNMTDAFTMRAVESWGYESLINVYTDLSLPDFPVYALLSVIFIIAFCTVFIRRDRYTIFFAFSTIISVFIAKGPNFPFGYLFTWMWFNFPHFAVFRAASRANMTTAFSLAFLVSVLVSILLSYAQKRRYAEPEVHLKAKAKFAEENEAREIHISMNVLNKAVKGVHKLLYYLSVLLLIFIFLSGFLSCFFFFSQGLQVYSPPESYIKPYDWLANQSGDYKVITVTNSPSQWMNLSFQESDFASGGMLTDIGWTHDIGYDSSFITDKPTLQEGGLDPSCRVFMNYFRYRLVRRELTVGFLRMLGPFNYKYLVLPEYLADDTRNFFLNQQGYHIVYNQSSLILQNDYYTPRFFVPSQHVTVMGGLVSYASLNQINAFNFNQTALFFANPTNEAFLQSTLNSSEALVFSDSDITDAAMLSLKNNATFIEAVDYSATSLNYSKYWISDTSWSVVGGFVWGGNTLTTNGKNNITITFKVDSDATYDVWLRIGFANNRGKLNILIDGAKAGEIQPLATSWAKPMWAKVGSVNLKSGDHKITLKNDGTGYNDVDMIAAVKPETFQSAMKDVLETLRSFPGRIIYILGGVNTFTLVLLPNWYVRLIPYEGYVLSADHAGTNIAPLGNASASSEGTWDTITLRANQANDGNTNTRWASNPYEPTPQWLQIEWSTPQEISGINILFERAYAQDYSIQTWDGAEWIDQINITGNTMLERYHSFPTTTTTKLRIYVTSVTQFNLVSIWELEAYKPQGIHTNITIPRESDYLFALRLATGPDKGRADLEVGNFTESVNCSDSNQGFSWKYFGPFNLDATNYTIAVGGNGKIDFNEMIIYSLNQNEQAFSVDDLFKPKPAPIITYDQANPCQYTVHVENSNGPFLLIFSESYEPMWKAYVENNEISPIPMYSAVNGFYINKTGNFDVTIYFTGQTYANIGLEISAATLITVVAIIAIPSQKLEKWGRRIKHQTLNINRTKEGCLTLR
jgi:hypothetical protein